MSYLPDSDRLDIEALSGLFRNTTNSYKYLFFLSLLTLIKERNFSIDKGILLRDIESEMLVTAWYPNVFFKLSFGTQDKISLALKQTFCRKVDARRCAIASLLILMRKCRPTTSCAMSPTEFCGRFLSAKPKVCRITW